MCGIVGYIGRRQAQEVLVRGLGKLEYRGYDSAGVAIYNNTGGMLQVCKKKGRLQKLADSLAADPVNGDLGIGHTRWATHGSPSDVNAHPHTDESGRFAVVHNGIIENYAELKAQLTEKGYTFCSETDTEVIAQLLSDLYDGNLVSTVRRATQMMKGAYALAVLCIDEPDRLVAVRLASPLVIGVGEGEFFIASDIPALLEYTRQVYLLEEGDMAVLTRQGVELLDREGHPLHRKPLSVTWDAGQAEKNGYEHFMLKEIHEQPQAIRDTLSGRISEDGRSVRLEEISLSKAFLKKLQRIDIVACGTAYHAGMVGKAVMESLARIPVEVDVASEYRYRNPLIDERTLVIVVSQSGETADTLAALRESQKRGARVLAITNVVGSSVAREADEVLLTMAGPEIAVASTKAYTAQLVAFYLLGLYLAQARESLAQEHIAAYLSALRQLPAQVETSLAQAEGLKGLAQMIKAHQHLFFIGRGLDYALSLEGSLKLKEISYIHSEAYAAGELKHGTLALIEEGTPVIALATQPHLFEKMLSNIKEVKARGAYVWVLGVVGSTAASLQEVADEIWTIPPVEPFVAPVLTVIPLQLLAYYTAVALGNDVDKPRNLAKSVTVE